MLQQSYPNISKGVLVLNYNYYSFQWDRAFKVGATSFASQVTNLLKRRNLLAGIVLYKRNDQLITPNVHLLLSEQRENVVVVEFNFLMPKSQLTAALDQAVCAINRQGEQVILYYHTDTLIQYHPEQYVCCVTHHGPFVEDFLKYYTREEADEAYGGEEKVDHLLKTQSEGLAHLLKSRKAFVIEHSALQKKFLIYHGVPAKKIVKITPPFASLPTSETELNDNVWDFVSSSTSEVIMVTCVARLDYFKNIQLFVQAFVQLVQIGVAVKALVVGGSDKDVETRLDLLDMVPKESQDKILFTNSVSQSELYSLFDCLVGKAVFVCTSRYETLGITPLEAALHGVCTIVPDLACVETGTYFPQIYKFRPTSELLTEKVIELIDCDLISNTQLKNYVGNQLCYDNFKNSFVRAWKFFSKYDLNL